MMKIVRVAVAEVVLILLSRRRRLTRPTLTSCSAGTRHAEESTSPQGRVACRRAMQIHVCTSVSSRSSREVCRACSALNSAALVSWMKSEDLGVISLFACSCVAQLQPSSSSRSRAPRWTVGQAPTSTSIEGNRILPAIASSGQSGERRKDHVLFSVRPGGPGGLVEVWWVKGEGSRPARGELGPLCSVALLVLELGCRQMPGLKI